MLDPTRKTPETSPPSTNLEAVPPSQSRLGVSPHRIKLEVSPRIRVSGSGHVTPHVSGDSLTVSQPTSAKRTQEIAARTNLAPFPDKGIPVLLPYLDSWAWEILCCTSKAWYAETINFIWTQKQPRILPLFSLTESLIHAMAEEKYAYQRRQIQQLAVNLNQPQKTASKQISCETTCKDGIAKIFNHLEPKEVKVLKKSAIKEMRRQKREELSSAFPNIKSTTLFRRDRKNALDKILELSNILRILESEGHYEEKTEKVRELIEIGHFKYALDFNETLNPKKPKETLRSQQLEEPLNPKKPEETLRSQPLEELVEIPSSEKSEDIISFLILDYFEELIECNGMKTLFSLCGNISNQSTRENSLYCLFTKCIEGGYLGTMKTYLHLMTTRTYKKALSATLAAAYVDQRQVNVAIQIINTFGYPKIRPSNPDSPHLEKLHHQSDFASGYVLCAIIKYLEKKGRRERAFTLIKKHHNTNQDLLTSKIVDITCKWDNLKLEEIQFIEKLSLSISEKEILVRTLLVVAKAYNKTDRKEEARKTLNMAFEALKSEPKIENYRALQKSLIFFKKHLKEDSTTS